jgi:hypothetical protein
MVQMALTPMTELDAVNAMLETIGQPPVSTLSGALALETSIAVDVLNSISREVQNVGWYFNTAYDVSFPLDNNNQAPVSSDALDVTITSHNNIIQRGTYLFDLEEQTNVLDPSTQGNIKGTTVNFLAFTDIPQAARSYITIKAARLFQKKVMGSADLDNLSQADENSARLKLLAEESNKRRSSFANPNLYLYRT